MTVAFRLFLVLTFVMIGRPQDFFGFLVPFRIALVFTAIALVATLFQKNISITSIWKKNKEVRLYGYFYLIMIIGIPFSIYRSKAFGFIFMQYPACLIFFYLLIVHTYSLYRLRKFMSTLVWSTLFYGLLVLLHGASQERVAYGDVFDPNDLAYYMVSLFPMALLFWGQDEKYTARIKASATFFVAVLITLLTQSRGGFVGLAAVLALLIMRPGGGIKKAHRIWIIIGIFAVFAFFGARISMERVRTMGEITNDYNISDEFGRLAIWKRGINIALENPLNGVGASNFGQAIGDQRKGEGLIPRWQAPHNSFLQIAAEIGFIGLFVFITLVITTYKNLGPRNKSDPEQLPFSDLNRSMSLIQIAFTGSLICAFFLSQAYSILFPIYFGLPVVRRRIESDLVLADKVSVTGPLSTRGQPETSF